MSTLHHESILEDCYDEAVEQFMINNKLDYEMFRQIEDHEGVMLAILLMNVFAPLIDHYVIESNVSMRRKRWQGAKLETT